MLFPLDLPEALQDAASSLFVCFLPCCILRQSISLETGWINLLDVYSFFPLLLKILKGLGCGFWLSLYMCIQLWKLSHQITSCVQANCQPLVNLGWNKCKMQFYTIKGAYYFLLSPWNSNSHVVCVVVLAGRHLWLTWVLHLQQMRCSKCDFWLKSAPQALLNQT